MIIFYDQLCLTLIIKCLFRECFPKCIDIIYLYEYIPNILLLYVNMYDYAAPLLCKDFPSFQLISVYCLSSLLRQARFSMFLYDPVLIFTPGAPSLVDKSRVWIFVDVCVPLCEDRYIKLLSSKSSENGVSDAVQSKYPSKSRPIAQGTFIAQCIGSAVSFINLNCIT